MTKIQKLAKRKLQIDLGDGRHIPLEKEVTRVAASIKVMLRNAMLGHVEVTDPALLFDEEARRLVQEILHEAVDEQMTALEERYV